MEFNTLILEKEEYLATLYINRPKALNALNSEALFELETAVRDIRSDSNIKVMIITGAGDKAFVAGADITFMVPLTSDEGRFFSDLGERVMRQIELLEKPVIAAINGFALGGGCELAMACDIRLASETAVFALPEVGLGIIPGFGGTQRLPRLIGEGRAKELTFTANKINAQEAFRIGLVNNVYPPDQLMDEAKNLAKKIAANAPLAVGYAKHAINKGLQVDIDTAMSIESDIFGLCCATIDKIEGMSAFVEKRKPKFEGK
ncbi:enoyl-CoA hydratase/carnithine racemase [Desulfosporosinus orientis DSM 765]|uniref:short-chain-enoyl-CoA hydratase n=1 Tax=Desulfosporosinus orientis (strain ATCC 19365 / DSM 765 / NCIMB 8382 / VKM B-1628 / Singapore I) TaxID=768706 RepID=G7WGR8_DESOD|nr:short-chain-enoyl-CoA hydratase [Desulfosporosinus orientis]AET68504.1 enoyl-CoA hydratase/carnithine racemase [Desulfosporosinus orientis DSM 765]